MIKIEKFPFAPKGDTRLEKWGYLKEAKKMSKSIKDGDVIFDCGANIFDHSVFFAVNFPQSKVVAFEPVSEYYNLGLKNMEYFKASNIIPLNVALGSEKGEAEISLENEASSFVTNSGSKEKVCIETIDELVFSGKIPAPDIIKIDVEGFALPLIIGARKTIEKYKPKVVIEVHPLFVGEKEAEKKLEELAKMNINIVKQFEMGREFLAVYNGKALDFRRCLKLSEIQEIRNDFDQSKSTEERIVLEQRYKKIRDEVRQLPISKRLFWSKIYIALSLKWVRK